MRPAVTPTIDYQTPRAVRTRDPLFWCRIALACGAIPLIVGTLIFGLWWLTRESALELLGLFTIIGGVGLFVVGLVATITFAHSARGASQPWRLRTTLALSLLCVNFPVCWAYNRVAESWQISLINTSSVTIQSFIVSDPAGNRWQLGSIGPFQSVRRSIHVQGEGALRFTSSGPNAAISGDISGYMTTIDFGEQKTITLNADGTFSVR